MKSKREGALPAHPQGGDGPIEPEFPAWRAFVVQVARDAPATAGGVAGRIEHLGTGRRRPFAGGEQLLAELAGLLRDIGESEDDDTPGAG